VKSYDERYFRHWYHDSATRIVGAATRARKVAMVVGVAEFVLGRSLKSVLDVGCGEAPWQPLLRKLRPQSTYSGVDSSEYAVRRFGRTRGIVSGTFEDAGDVVPRRQYDLVVVSDVIHYLEKREVERGLSGLVERMGGIAYLDFFTSRDSVEGDMREMKLRSPQYYLRLFRSHGLLPLGLQFYAPEWAVDNLTVMELMSALPAQSRGARA
jgi:SAM-dependent methyltransferase